MERHLEAEGVDDCSTVRLRGVREEADVAARAIGRRVRARDVILLVRCERLFRGFQRRLRDGMNGEGELERVR